MIIDLKRFIDQRWLFDPVLSFLLGWSCFCQFLKILHECHSWHSWHIPRLWLGDAWFWSWIRIYDRYYFAVSPQFIFECTVATLSTLKRNLGEVFKDKSWEFIPDATVSTLSLLCQKIFCLATYKLFRLQRIGIYRLICRIYWSVLWPVLFY